MELKANELKYGNKLLFLGDVVTFKNITEIREDGIFWIKTIEPKIESKNFHFKPIPLTEEWKPKIVSWLSDDYKIEWKNNRINFYFNNGYIATCDYLHEYQNLYFALTNEELEIKM